MVRKAPMLIVLRFGLLRKHRDLIVSIATTLSLLMSSSASAQKTKPAAVATSTTAPAKIEQPQSAWTLGLGVEYSENAAQQEEGPKESGMELTIAPSLKINKSLSLGVKSSLIQASTEDKKPTLSNTQIGLGIKGWTLTDSISSVHSIATVLPTSIASKESDRLQSSLSITNGLAMIINPRFDLTFKLGLSRNFHEFTINADGRANVEYRLTQSLDLKLMLIQDLYLTTTGVLRQGRTYQGFERQDFQFHGDINYDFLENWTMNLGTSNVGPALKANGVDSNISVYDAKSTVWRFGISAVL
jgi:hypothetical protein